MSRKLAGLQVKHLDFTVPSSPSGPPAPSLLPSSPILFQGKPHFNEGLRAQAFCSLFFGQSSAKWSWIIFAIFLFCKGRDPGRPWGKEVREFNYLQILPLSPYFCSSFFKKLHFSSKWPHREVSVASPSDCPPMPSWQPRFLVVQPIPFRSAPSLLRMNSWRGPRALRVPQP